MLVLNNRSVNSGDGLAAIAHSNYFASKMHSKAIRDGATDIAEKILPSAYAISRSIVSSSCNISLALHSISNEIERNNKLNEYYMLMNEIEKLENYCINHKIINHIYQEMNLISLSVIEELSTEQYLRLSCLFRRQNNLSLIKNIVQQRLISPIEAIASLISDNNFSFQCIWGEDTTCLCGTNIRFHDKNRIIANSTSYEELLRTLPQAIDDLKVSFDDLTDQHKATVLEDRDKWNKLISECNREIQLINLRNLYLNLKDGIRRYKLEAAM